MRTKNTNPPPAGAGPQVSPPRLTLGGRGGCRGQTGPHSVPVYPWQWVLASTERHPIKSHTSSLRGRGGATNHNLWGDICDVGIWCVQVRSDRHTTWQRSSPKLSQKKGREFGQFFFCDQLLFSRLKICPTKEEPDCRFVLVLEVLNHYRAETIFRHAKKVEDTRPVVH